MNHCPSTTQSKVTVLEFEVASPRSPDARAVQPDNGINQIVSTQPSPTSDSGSARRFGKPQHATLPRIQIPMRIETPVGAREPFGKSMPSTLFFHGSGQLTSATFGLAAVAGFPPVASSSNPYAPPVTLIRESSPSRSFSHLGRFKFPMNSDE
jgi:hypothetical protein